MSSVLPACLASVSRASIEYSLKGSGRNADPPSCARSAGTIRARSSSAVGGMEKLSGLLDAPRVAHPCRTSANSRPIVIETNLQVSVRIDGLRMNRLEREGEHGQRRRTRADTVIV